VKRNNDPPSVAHILDTNLLCGSMGVATSLMQSAHVDPVQPDEAGSEALVIVVGATKLKDGLMTAGLESPPPPPQEVIKTNDVTSKSKFFIL
tara:strand:- start:35 stop:310 length:276 start_codon:yes stop_codon:yes gene_type:complete